MIGATTMTRARAVCGVLLLAVATCGEPSEERPISAHEVPVESARSDSLDGAAILEVEGPLDLLPAVRVRREAEDAGDPGPRVRWCEVPSQRVVSVPTPAGFRTSVAATSDVALVWPPWVPLAPGARARLRVEPLCDVRLVLPPEVGGRPSAEGDPLVLVLVDRTAAPPGPPGRVAALDLLSGTGRFGDVVRSPDGIRLSSMPPVPCHVFLRRGAAVASARWDGSAPTIGWPAFPQRAIVEEPLLGGAVLPPGGIVAPGRLDVAAVAALTRASARRIDGAFHLRRGGIWTPVALPDAPVYTLWHPDRGIAHAVPDPTGALVGVPPPGEIVLVAADGSEISGHAAAWPCWPGDRRSFTRPDDTGLRRSFVRTRAARFRGLPAGTWRLDYAFAAGGAEPGRALRRAEVVLADATPRATVIVHVDGPAGDAARTAGEGR